MLELGMSSAVFVGAVLQPVKTDGGWYVAVSGPGGYHKTAGPFSTPLDAGIFIGTVGTQIGLAVETILTSVLGGGEDEDEGS